MGLTAAAVKAAIDAHPEARALVLVHPTYYGVTFDLSVLAELVHAHGMLLLVDEAMARICVSAGNCRRRHLTAARISSRRARTRCWAP